MMLGATSSIVAMRCHRTTHYDNRSTAFLEKGEPLRERSPQHSVSTKGLGPCASQPGGPFSSRTAVESGGRARLARSLRISKGDCAYGLVPSDRNRGRSEDCSALVEPESRRISSYAPSHRRVGS